MLLTPGRVSGFFFSLCTANLFFFWGSCRSLRGLRITVDIVLQMERRFFFLFLFQLNWLHGQALYR